MRGFDRILVPRGRALKLKIKSTYCSHWTFFNFFFCELIKIDLKKYLGMKGGDEVFALWVGKL